MLIAFIVAAVLAGVLAGFSAHQREEIKRKDEEVDDLRQEVVRLNSRLAEANAEIKAHTTSLFMLMGEVDREDNATS